MAGTVRPVERLAHAVLLQAPPLRGAGDTGRARGGWLPERRPRRAYRNETGALASSSAAGSASTPVSASPPVLYTTGGVPCAGCYIGSARMARSARPQEQVRPGFNLVRSARHNRSPQTAIPDAAGASPRQFLSYIACPLPSQAHADVGSAEQHRHRRKHPVDALLLDQPPDHPSSGACIAASSA